MPAAKKKPSVRAAKRAQGWLYDYLNIDIDPYDFRQYLEEWAEEAGMKLDEDPEVSDLTEEDRNDFQAWLIEGEKGIDWVSSGDIYAPAYLYFDNVEKLPAGSWCIHFTNANPFDSFEHGTTLEGLALSTHKKKKDTVRCKDNLSDRIGSFETVYGFAFLASDRNALSMGAQYGTNAVLFKTDAGVRAYHIGDEQSQVIFPLCSEYDAMVIGVDGTDVTVTAQDGKELTFESLRDLVEWAS